MVQLTLADIILSSLGGILISISTSFHLYMKGRVTGFSGIFYSLITLDKSSLYWKIALVCGLISTSAVLYDIFGFDKIWDNSQIFDSPQVMIGNLDFVGFGIAGLLTGIGTKMSNGCTSGHGVCGLPRFARRSWVAVGTFLSVAIGVATFKNYVQFLDGTQGGNVVSSSNYDVCANIFLGLSLAVLIALFIFEKKDKLDILVGYITGVIFAIGLGFGGMFRRSKIIGFLALDSDWDPSLMFLLGFAVGLNVLTFYLIQYKIKKPLLAEKFSIPSNNTIDVRLVAGAALFGIGWGLGGLCPGPAMSLLPIFSLQISIVWLIFLGLGQMSVAQVDKYLENKQKSKQQLQIDDSNISLSQNQK